MNSRTKVLAPLGIFTLLAGCYHATIETGAPPSGQIEKRGFAPGFLYGLVPPKTLSTQAKCPNGVSKVETQISFVNGLVAALTLQIFTPMTIEVACAAAPASIAAPASGGTAPPSPAAVAPTGAVVVSPPSAVVVAPATAAPSSPGVSPPAPNGNTAPASGQVVGHKRPKVEIGADAEIARDRYTQFGDSRVTNTDFPNGLFRIGFFLGSAMEFEPSFQYLHAKQTLDGQEQFKFGSSRIGLALLLHPAGAGAGAAPFIGPEVTRLHLESGYTQYSVGGQLGVKLRLGESAVLRIGGGARKLLKNTSDGVPSGSRLFIRLGLSAYIH